MVWCCAIVNLCIVLWWCDFALCFMKFRDFSFFNLLVLELNARCCYGCEGFTHPLGREEKSRVKGLVGLEI